MNSKQPNPAVLLVIAVAVIAACAFVYQQFLVPLPLAQQPLPECVPLAKEAKEKTVVMRVDDIQAFAWSDTTRLMITDAEERNVPLVLGVIPKRLMQDEPLVHFLRERHCRHEIAIHGFDHLPHGQNDELAEFQTLDYAEAKHRLEHGLQGLAVVTNEPITTWVPPRNTHSTGTTVALTELGVTRWSTKGEDRWDYDADTYHYNTDAKHPADPVIRECEITFATSDVCIVMLHPQDFTNADGSYNEEKYSKLYIDLLDRLRDRGYGFGTFADVDV